MCLCVCFLQGQTGPSADGNAFDCLSSSRCLYQHQTNGKEETPKERLPVYLSAEQRKIAANKVFIKQIVLGLTIKLGFTEGTSLTFHTLSGDLLKIQNKNCKFETSLFAERWPHRDQK